ncbi:PAS domain-containing protein [Tautonia sp. JC769]|uniref:PAS domain-containing protein n=1 Tax=Tautonia sp. JC769 TaxID=3232135 RepID=UPI00345950C2
MNPDRGRWRGRQPRLGEVHPRPSIKGPSRGMRRCLVGNKRVEPALRTSPQSRRAGRPRWWSARTATPKGLTSGQVQAEYGRMNGLGSVLDPGANHSVVSVASASEPASEPRLATCCNRS